MEIYSRYAIVAKVMLQEGSERLARYLEGTWAKCRTRWGCSPGRGLDNSARNFVGWRGVRG
jgi:hypothetical protein